MAEVEEAEEETTTKEDQKPTRMASRLQERSRRLTTVDKEVVEEATKTVKPAELKMANAAEEKGHRLLNPNQLRTT